jgi:hypothetical protein
MINDRGTSFFVTHLMIPGCRQGLNDHGVKARSHFCVTFGNDPWQRSWDEDQVKITGCNFETV